MSANSKSLLKRFTAAICLAFIFSNLQVTSAQAIGCTSGLFGGGSGTEGDPFQVATTQQFLNVQNCLSGDYWFRQTADIDLSQHSPWQPFSIFDGNYDGADFDITNITLSGAGSTGLFSTIEQGTVKNLNLVANAVFSGENFSQGVLAERLNSATISNIKVTADITSNEGMATTGGVVGYVNESDASDIEFIAATPANPLELNTFITGGLFGYITSQSDVSELTLTADVENNVAGSIAGGAIGYLASSTADNVEFTGDLSVLEATVGGIAGYVTESSLNNATHTGNVVYESEVGFTSTGGIAGYFTDSTGTGLKQVGDVEGLDSVGGVVGYFTESEITDVEVDGDIHGTDAVGGITGRHSGTVTDAKFVGAIYGKEKLGGIAGNCSSTLGFDENFNFVEIRGVISGAEISVDVVVLENGGDDNAWTHTGGVVGNMYECDISQVQVTGNVSGRQFAGGVAGYSSGSTFMNVFADVNVTSEGDFAGGFIGYGSSSSITNSYANGSISTTSPEMSGVGGLIGYSAEMTISKVFANAQVTGLNNVGGAFGFGFNSTVTDSYFTGTVSSTGGVVGNLVGQGDSNQFERVYVSNLGLNNTDINLFGGNGGSFPNIVQNSYLDSTNDGVTDVKYFNSKQMRSVAAFKSLGWDFADVWAKLDNVNGGMPILRTAKPANVCTSVKLSSVFFASGKTKLTAKAKKQLKKQVNKIAISPCMNIQIDGHTSIYESGDKKTPKAKLKKIAAKRIAVVRNYIQNSLNSVREGYVISVSNKYKSKPIASNKTKKGQARNRQVAITLIG